MAGALLLALEPRKPRLQAALHEATGNDETPARSCDRKQRNDGDGWHLRCCWCSRKGSQDDLKVRQETASIPREPSNVVHSAAPSLLFYYYSIPTYNKLQVPMVSPKLVSSSSLDFFKFSLISPSLEWLRITSTSQVCLEVLRRSFRLVRPFRARIRQDLTYYVVSFFQDSGSPFDCPSSDGEYARPRKKASKCLISRTEVRMEWFSGIYLLNQSPESGVQRKEPSYCTWRCQGTLARRLA